jgi:hypothetical protein
MRRLILLPLLLVFVVPGQARAAAPCRDKIYSDWYADGKIASTYSHACYVDALRHVPAASEEYSSLRDDITAAMRAGALHAEGKVVPKEVGHGFAPHNVLVSGTPAATQSTPHNNNTAPPPASSSKDPGTSEASANGSPGEVAAASSGAPVPVLVLGGLALVLLAAGAIGAGVKHARSRRG